MSQFLQNAQEIFEAAENSAAAGHTSSNYTILLGGQGGIRMIADSDWSLGALQREHGAKQAYRVQNAGGLVSVDGRDGQHNCHLEAASAQQTAQFLLNAMPAWHATLASTHLLA